MPEKLHSLISCMRILECEGRHLFPATPIHNMDTNGAQPDRSDRRIDGSVPCPHHDHTCRYCRQDAGLVTGDQVQRVGDSREIFPRNSELVNCAQTDSQKDGIVLPLKLCQRSNVDHCVKEKIDAQLRQHLNLTKALNERQLIFSDPIRIQASRQRTSVVEIGVNAAPAKFCRTGKRGRPSANQCYGKSRLCTRLERQPSATFMERVHCESLQPRNLYRLFVVTMHYAGALTEYLHRTRSSTARTEDICIENSARRAG